MTTRILVYNLQMSTVNLQYEYVKYTHHLVFSLKGLETACAGSMSSFGRMNMQRRCTERRAHFDALALTCNLVTYAVADMT